MSGELSFAVTGMTCDHCVRSVTNSVTAVPGVDSVHVDLSTGTVTVGGPDEVPVQQVREAIEKAGYSTVTG